MVQIENYFFECSSFNITPHEHGTSQRSFGGKLYTSSNYKYKEISCVIEGVPPSMHSNLQDIVLKNRSWNDTNAESLTFIDEQGEIYTVDIPVDGYSYSVDSDGDGRYWKWEINFETV